MPEVEELDEQSLFNEVAEGDLDTPVADVAEVPEKPEEPVRDEAGRFAKADEPEKPVDATAEKPVVDDNAPQVPSWRVREINDEKRALADRLTALETERNQWLAERQRLTAAEKPQEKAARPDPLLDPEGYAKAVRDDIREEMLNDRRETSLANAHKQYKGEFEEAYAAAQKQVDPALKARMQQSRDPGETLMEWHRERKTQAEIGGDLNAYKAKLREEALKDPEFRKVAMEAWRNDANPQTPGGRPRVDLPPSLNGASRSNALLRSGDGDVPDHELWNEITGTG